MQVTMMVTVTAPDGTEDIPGAVDFALDGLRLRDWSILVYDPRTGPAVHVRIVQGGELIADLPDWPYPVPRRGDYIFHPPFRSGRPGPENIAGCVKTVTWRTHDRPADPEATAFVQTASPYVELVI